MTSLVPIGYLDRIRDRACKQRVIVTPDQFPIKVSLKRRFFRFIKKCLSSSNSIVNVISHIAICNPMSTAGKNYRSVLDANGDYNTNQMVTSWQYTCESIK